MYHHKTADIMQTSAANGWALYSKVLTSHWCRWHADVDYLISSFTYVKSNLPLMIYLVLQIIMLHNEFDISVEICFITTSRQYVSLRIQSMILYFWSDFTNFSNHFSSSSIRCNRRNVNYIVVKDAYRTVAFALLQYIKMDELWNLESDNFNVNIDKCNQFSNKSMI